MSNSSSSHSLWQFMLNTYAKAGVKEQCLRAQNEYGLDVLLLLMDVWLKKENLAWPKQSELQAYLAWRKQMIVPLRALRMSLAKDEEPLRSQLLTAELSVEKKGVALLSCAQPNTDEIKPTHFLEKDYVFFTAVNTDFVLVDIKDAHGFYELFTKLLSTK